MKKLIMAAMIATMMSAPVHAACEGGTEVGGFCISDFTMNWWTAYAWCKGNNRTFATIYDVCPNWTGSTGGNQCGRTVSSYNRGMAWTATAYGTDKAHRVNLADGSVKITSGRDIAWPAICK